MRGKGRKRWIHLGGLLLSLALVGGCSSITHTTSVEIERSVETAWAVFADDARLGAWMHASWAHGGMPWVEGQAESIGHSRMVTLREGEEELVLTHTITSIREKEEYGFELDHDEWMDSENLFRFEPRGPRACIVHWTATIRPKGFRKRVLVNLWRGAIKGRYREHLTKLEALVEAEPAGS